MRDRSRPKEPPVPAPHVETGRQALLEALRHGRTTARSLSAAVGMREKDVLVHLEHLARSLEARGETLHIDPARCLACEYVFHDRRALGRPSRCPRCKGERIEAPRFGVGDGDRDGDDDDAS